MKQKDMHLALSLKLEKLDSQILSMHERFSDIKNNQAYITKRLDVIEKQHSFVRGSVSAILFLGGLMGVVMDHIAKWVLSR